MRDAGRRRGERLSAERRTQLRDTIDAESGGRAIEAEQRLPHQRGRHHDNDRQRHFAADERVPPRSARRLNAAAAGIPQAGNHVEARGLPRRQERDQYSRCNGCRGREGEDASVDDGAIEKRDARAGWNEMDEQRQDEHREQRPDGAASCREHRALEQEFRGDLPSARAERCPDRDLAGTLRTADERQVRDVGAGDQQDETDADQQRARNVCERADHVLTQRHQGDAPAVVGVGMRLGDACSRRGHGTLCAFERHTSRHAAVHQDVARRSIGALRAERRWHPEPRLDVENMRRVEIGRHDADYGVGFAVEIDHAADDGPITSEHGLPDCIRDDDDAVPARRVFALSKCAANERPRSEHVEVIRGDRVD